MSRNRKTYEVSKLVDMVNRHNAKTDLKGYRSPETRRAQSSLLESVLHDTGNYRGFNYLVTELTPDFKSVRKGHDDTRRFYYGGTLDRHTLGHALAASLPEIVK